MCLKIKDKKRLNGKIGSSVGLQKNITNILKIKNNKINMLKICEK